MKVIAKKTRYLSVFVFELIVGMILMAAAVVVPPVGIYYLDSSLFANPQFMGFILIVMLGFALVGYFMFLRPYMLYRKMPEIQAETDGEYLYIHSKKEAKIPFCAREDAYIYSDTPVYFGKEFIIHLLSEQYGNVVIDVPQYGKYKLYYVANAQDVASKIISLAENKINR